MEGTAVIFIVSILASTIRLSTPLIFASIGGLYSERSGVVNIALEGIMLYASFTAATVNYMTGNPWLGLLAGMASGGLIALIHGIATIQFKADQVVSGTAINILAMGLVPVICKHMFEVTGSTPSLSMQSRFHDWSIPLINKIPIIGDIIGKHTPLVYIAIIVVILTQFIIFKTVFGLRLRATGEYAEAADTAGINVIKMRYIGVIISGILAGMGGAFLSIAHGSAYARNMTAGRGFIALTALIFGGWKPIPTALACLLFGFADALQIRLQGVQFKYVGEIPGQFIQILPYVVTMVVLAGFIGKTVSPKNLGVPFQKER
jgi:general nucleoside transport system permease protein